MKIAISGTSGYIARNLIVELKEAHHEVVAIKKSTLYNIDQLTELLTNTSVVINLAGAPILTRWTKTSKNEIFRSRIDTTQNIVKAINGIASDKRPSLFISASAVGIYSSNELHTEESTSFSNDFVGEIVKSWEKASEQLIPTVRKVIFRIGLILGKDAKTIQNLVPVFKMGLGGEIGSGKQPFPFIHISDVTKAIIWSIENEKSQGIYNLVAPENIDNKTFTKTLAKRLNRHSFFTIPAFALKILLGEASTLLLQSPQVFPERLLNEGFVFSFPDIISSIEEIIQ
jgi:uncharacterized protein (TIGR01777 family)